MKFSIITPVYNGEKHLTETIESVLSQEGDFEIEYIIRDGGSTDGTLAIIRSYDDRLKAGTYPIKCSRVTLLWVSEKDQGMYDAINKGFTQATGDIYAYINADDLYTPGALQSIGSTFAKYPTIRWLKGITSFIDESSQKTQSGACYIYNQRWITRGIYGRNAYFIHQDSVFWRRELWEKVGGIDTRFKLAGDYYLWIQLSRFAPLWSLDAPISLFRKTAGQLSENMRKYRTEQTHISKPYGILNYKVKLFFWLTTRFSAPFFRPLFLAWYRILFPTRNKNYVALDKHGEPHIKQAYSYII